MVLNAPKRKETHQNMSLRSNGVDRERSLWKIPTRLCGTNFCINCTSLARFAASLCSREMVPNAPKRKEMQQNMSLGSNGMHQERRYEKFRHDFVARTFALIAPVWRILQQVSCSSETVLNAPKRKGRHQNMRLGSNGMDPKCSLWKIRRRHHGTHFFINCTSLARFAASFV